MRIWLFSHARRSLTWYVPIRYRASRRLGAGFRPFLTAHPGASSCPASVTGKRWRPPATGIMTTWSGLHASLPTVRRQKEWQFSGFQNSHTRPRQPARRATFQPLGSLLRKKGTWLSAKFPLSIAMVPKGGFEPPRVSPPPPQAALPLTSDYNHFVYRIVTTASA